jgi:protocatechuate 3,4-dioxygenase beta subunit
MQPVRTGGASSALYRTPLRLLLALLFLAPGVLAPRPALAQTGTVSGFVVDTTGSRIGGATIRVVAGPNTGRETTSDATGAYSLGSLAPGTSRFAVRHDGFEDVTRDFRLASGTTARVDFTLRPVDPLAGSIQGTVVQRGTNRPLPDAAVVITTAGLPPRTLATDDAGFYRLPNLASGSYRVQVSRQGFTGQNRTVSVRQSRTTVANFALRTRTGDLGTLQGRVTDATGRQLGNVRVDLVRGGSRGSSAITSRTGFFRFRHVIPGAYDVRFAAFGFVTATATGVVVPRHGTFTLNQQLTSLGPTTATLEGTITDSSGQGISGARVQITTGSGAGRFDITDTGGFYRIRNLPPGHQVFSVSAENFQTATGEADLAENTSGQVNLTLASIPLEEGGALAGKVTAGGAQELAGVTVLVTNGPTIGEQDVTDAGGNFSLPDLPEGIYTLTFRRANFQDVLVSNLSVTKGQTTTVNADLQALAGTGAIAGTVVEEVLGLPLEGVLVEVFAGAERVAVGTTTGGRFEIHGLTPGIYSLRFSKPGYRAANFRNTQVFNDFTTTLDVRLPLSGPNVGAIVGLVRDTGGGPVQEVQVELEGPSGTIVSQTDANGTFAFSDLPAGGGYSISISDPGLISDVRPGIVVGASQTTTLVFTVRAKIGTGSIVGLVRSVSGGAIEGASVRILRGPRVGLARATGKDGRYSFVGLTPGTYVLNVSAPGFQSRQINVPVRAGSSSQQAFFLFPESAGIR